MVYEEKEFIIMESILLNFKEHSKIVNLLLKDWIKECDFFSTVKTRQVHDYLKYADARRKLMGMLQNCLVNFEEEERYPVCDLILQLMKFSNCNDERERTSLQEQSWYINRVLKKFDFNYWEGMLREVGEDETDVVRKLYKYIQNWENRVEVADTFYEYIENHISDEDECNELLQFAEKLVSFIP